jgi:hypothetical protein
MTHEALAPAPVPPFPPDPWPERIKAFFAGMGDLTRSVKDLALIILMIVGGYQQSNIATQQQAIKATVDSTEKKADTAAVVAQEVKKDLKAASSAAEKVDP